MWSSRTVRVAMRGRRLWDTIAAALYWGLVKERNNSIFIGMARQHTLHTFSSYSKLSVGFPCSQVLEGHLC